MSTFGDSGYGSEPPPSNIYFAPLRSPARPSWWRHKLLKELFYAASPQLPRRLNWIPEGRRQRLVWREDILRPHHNDVHREDSVWNAELSVLGVVQPDDCWLSVKCDDPSTIHHARLICQLSEPEEPTLQTDFRQAMSNLDIIMSDTTGSSTCSVLVRDGGIIKLRVRHVPFVVGYLLR